MAFVADWPAYMLMSNMRLYSTIFGLSAKKIATYLAITIAAAALEGFGMAMLLPVLDYIEKNQGADYLASSSEMWRKIIYIYSLVNVPLNLPSLLTGALAVMLLRVVAIYARQMYSAWLAQDIQHCARSNLLDRYLEMSYEQFVRMSNGSLVNVLSTETPRAVGMFSAVASITANGVVAIGFIGVLMWISLYLTLLALCFIGFAVFAVSFRVKNTRSNSFLFTKSNDAYARAVLEKLNAFRLIKILGATEREASKARDASLCVRDRMYSLTKAINAVELVLEPFVLIGGGIIIYVAVSIFTMSLAEIGLFGMILLRLLPLAKELVKSQQTFRACSGSFSSVIESFVTAGNSREHVKSGDIVQAITGDIELINVTYSYPSASGSAVSGVSIVIPANSITAIVGPSGSGKSTLVDLIARLRVPTAGTILYCGIDASEMDTSEVRRQMSFVSQDTVILDGTVAENLRFSNPTASDAELRTALDLACASQFVDSLHDGIDTKLGDQGVMLSGGQRQRLALARALLQKTSVLILDEPTSAQDPETEREIRTALMRLRASSNIRIVIIAHSIRTIADADQIIVLGEGRVEGCGTHKDLLSSNNWYAEANTISQSNGFSKA